MYNPLIHNRQSRRLKGYDYASAGLYFITLNTENREQLFGEIKDGRMILTEAGLIAQKYWLEIPDHYPHAALHDFVIMPDHIHGVIEIIYNPNLIDHSVAVGANNYSPRRLRLDRMDQQSLFKSPSKTIGSVIRGFKTGVTKWMRKYTTVHRVWQRDYYEHIIRDTESYHRICQYIRDNPKNWKEK
ncbi:transposase [Fluviicola sp.]|uniref:transposase n=1 Tax=Fluviicola sp. TaxID=1917219 RepID=UPI003D28F6E2